MQKYIEAGKIKCNAEAMKDWNVDTEDCPCQCKRQGQENEKQDLKQCTTCDLFFHPECYIRPIPHRLVILPRGFQCAPCHEDHLTKLAKMGLSREKGHEHNKKLKASIAKQVKARRKRKAAAIKQTTLPKTTSRKKRDRDGNETTGAAHAPRPPAQPPPKRKKGRK